LLLLSLCCGREEQWGCLLEEDSHATLDSSLPTPTRSNARSSTRGGEEESGEDRSTEERQKEELERGEERAGGRGREEGETWEGDDGWILLKIEIISCEPCEMKN
jgi:hypothetical protein